MTKVCDKLLHGIHFSQEQIRACCMTFKGAIFAQNLVGDCFSDIIAERNLMLKKLKGGIVPTACKGCYELKEGDFDGDTKISVVHLNHYLQCNSMCAHCNNVDYPRQFSETPQKSGFYEVMPYLKRLDENGMFSDFINVFFTGGEPTCLSEMPEILDFFGGKNSFIVLFSSGILFSEKIANLMSQNKLRLVISLDCGDSKTFKKIKRVDKFNQVLENVKKYANFNSKQNDTYSCINLKYVILKGFNDSEEEIDKFFEVAKFCGVTDVQPDFNNSPKIFGEKLPEKEISLMNSFVQKASALGFRCEVTSRVENCVKKRLYI